MGKSVLKGYEQEIKQCIRLYAGFSESEHLAAAVSSAIQDYFKDNPLAPLPEIDLENSTELIRAGKSINLNPNLKTEAVVGLLKRINNSLLKANPQLRETIGILNDAFDQFLSEFPDEVSKKEIIELRDSLLEETVLEQDLATFLFSLLLSSFYRQHLKTSSEVLRTDLWEGGDCPLCGEKPHFGLLRTEDGAKQLECWLCGTSWVHTRIKCPFCDNTEQEDLGYFTAEENEVCRVNFCKKCCQYYKIFDARKIQADGEINLTIHNIATLAYDLLARQEGFKPGSGLEWINESEVTERQD